MIKFPSIGKFLTVLDCINYIVANKFVPEPPVLTFRATVKVHGTNGGLVKYEDGSIKFQSRERELTPEDDNMGFAAFMSKIGTSTLDEMLFKPLESKLSESGVKVEYPLAIFGEFAGTGVTKKVSVSKLPVFFMVFSAHHGELVENTKNWVSDDILGTVKLADRRIFNALDFPVLKIDIDFKNPKPALELAEQETAKIDKVCPVGLVLGKEGTGEGLVWVCITPGYENNRYWFKTKGDSHKQNKTRSETDTSDESYSAVKALVEEYLTESRLERGIAHLHEKGISLTQANTGQFVQFVCSDIVKDSQAALTASNIDEKAVFKTASKPCAQWYFKYMNASAGLA